ncbi:MAG: hypothetical protein ACFFC7_22960 [Candidatus Hermodarchaeota archaeon]
MGNQNKPPKACDKKGERKEAQPVSEDHELDYIVRKRRIKVIIKGIPDDLKDDLFYTLVHYARIEYPFLPSNYQLALVQALEAVIYNEVEPQQNRATRHKITKKAKDSPEKLSVDDWLVMAACLVKSYQHRAVEQRVLELSQEVTDRCMEHNEDAAYLFEQGQVFGKKTDAANALAKRLKDRSNIGQASYLVLTQTSNQYLKQLKKLKDITRFFEERPAEWASFLLFGTSVFAAKCLARRWRTKFRYAAAMLTSVRRKLDASLPGEFQIHQSAERPLFPPLSQASFEEGCDEVLDGVDQSIKQAQERGRPYKHIETFKNKVIYLRANASPLLELLFLDADQPLRLGWRSHSKISKTLQERLVPRPRAKHLKSALRAVLSHASSRPTSRLAAEIQSISVSDSLVAHQVLTKPFGTKKTVYHYWKHMQQPTTTEDLIKPLKNFIYPNLQPIALMMGAKYVIARDGNYPELTKHLKDYGYLELIIPKCLPVVKKNKRLDSPPPILNNLKRVPLRVRIETTENIKKLLKYGAQLHLITIIPPKLPRHKITAALTFSLPNLDSCAATNHLQPKYLDTYLQDLQKQLELPDFQPQARSHLGIDLNRICEYLIGYSNALPLTSELHHMCTLYHTLSDHISDLNRLLSKHLAKGTRTAQQIRNYNRELTLLYDKRRTLRTEVHNRVVVELGCMMALVQSPHLVTEQITLDATGKRGGRAKAIYTMLDDLALLHRVVRNLRAQFPEVLWDLELLSPNNTSLIHVGCPAGQTEPNKPGKLQRTAKHYDLAYCEQCGKLVNTHTNAAQTLVCRAKELPFTTLPSAL